MEGGSSTSPLRYSDVDYLNSLDHVTDVMAIGKIAQTTVKTGDIEVSVTFIGVDYSIYSNFYDESKIND